jgi:hypothetical protein
MSYIRFSIVPLIYMPLLIMSIFLGGKVTGYMAMFIALSYFILDFFCDRPGDPRKVKFPLILDLMLYIYVFQSMFVIFSLVWLFSPDDVLGFSAYIEQSFGYDILHLKIKNIGGLITSALLSGFVLSINMVVGHELTHRTRSVIDSTIGKVSLSIVGDSQFSISHIYCHHKNVATREDAASARRGESIYAFIIRSSLGQYVEAWNYVRVRLGGAGKLLLGPSNHLIRGGALTFVIGLSCFLLGGLYSLFAYVLVCIVSKLTYESTNYIQHYGLVRVPGEIVRKCHSWDCRSAFSSSALLNLTRHSAHHQSPNKKYWELESDVNGLVIDNGYVIQILRALFPFYWFSYMEKKIHIWESTQATKGELDIIKIEGGNNV